MLLIIEMTEATDFWHNSIYRSLEISPMSDSRRQSVWAITLYMCAEILTFANIFEIKERGYYLQQRQRVCI